jgi:hypothetical protein
MAIICTSICLTVVRGIITRSSQHKRLQIDMLQVPTCLLATYLTLLLPELLIKIKTSGNRRIYFVVTGEN